MRPIAPEAHSRSRRRAAGPSTSATASTACQNRAARLRRFGERRRYGVSGVRVDEDALSDLRERAVGELVLGALVGAEAATLAKVAGLVVACDRRLARLG